MYEALRARLARVEAMRVGGRRMEVARAALRAIDGGGNVGTDGLIHFNMDEARALAGRYGIADMPILNVLE